MTVSPAAARAWVAFGIVVGVLVVYEIREILLPFVIAAALAYLGSPIIRVAQRRAGWPRPVAAVLAFAVVVGAIGAVAYVIATLIGGELAQVSREAPDIVHGLVLQTIGRHHLTVLGLPLDSQRLADRLLAEAREVITSASGVKRLAGAGLAIVLGAFLTVILTIYFMISAPRLLRGLLWLVPPTRRPTVRRLALSVAPLLGRYVVGVFLVVTYASVMAWVGYGLVFALPNAVLLSFVVGLLELIPVVGPVTAAVLVGIAAIQQTSLAATVAIMLWAIALRLSIDQLVGPLLLGRAVSLHPVVIILSFLVGGLFFGVAGVLLAVPVAGTIKLVLADLYGDADA